MISLLLLMGAAFLAGALNSVAGGGSFLTFPALILAGVPSVVANASSTVALVTGSMASGFAYRDDLRKVDPALLRIWLLISLLGGAAGAFLLLHTSDRAFQHATPWLLLFATVIFTFGGKLHALLRGRSEANGAAMLAVLIPITVYGGYFGGGIGILLLAAFRLYGLADIHQMNGLKTIIAATLNTVAAIIFIAANQVAWRPTLYMTVAGIAGGYLGPVLARRVQPQMIRGLVMGIGFAMTLYFFSTAFR